ncbi:MAG: HD domain-containing protein [Bacilli bacterium]|nr:HD domain-containing protein [Bacilli bacterium]
MNNLIVGVFKIDEEIVKKILNEFSSNIEFKIISNYEDINNSSLIELPDVLILQNNNESKQLVKNIKIKREGIVMSIFCIDNSLKSGHIFLDIDMAKKCSEECTQNDLEINDLEKIITDIRKNKIKISLRQDILEIENIKFYLQMINFWDSYTKGHCERTQQYVNMLINLIDLDDISKRNISNAALIHDIGKIAVPKYILSSNKRLDEEEYERIKRHSIYSDNFLMNEKYKEIRKLINQHHENYDGSGYPLHLSKDQIEIGAYIISIADSFDAMTTPRGYNKVKTLNEAKEEIIKFSGKQFNPYIVKCFIELMNTHEFINYYNRINDIFKEDKQKIKHQ